MDKKQIKNLVNDANSCLNSKFDVEKVSKGFEFFLEKINSIGVKKENKPIAATATPPAVEPKITDLKKAEEQVKLFWRDKNKSLEKVYGKGNVWTNRGY